MLADYRLTPIPETKLDPDQRVAWDELRAGKRAAKAVRAEGFLVGPFDVLLRVPEVGRTIAQLGELLRFDATLPARQRELTIMIVAAHWHADFAWLRHDEYALQAGIPRAVVEAIAAGRTPDFDDDGDRLVHSIVQPLVTTGRVDDQAYAAGLAALGERQLVELVTLAGYYCMDSLILNAFRVPLPDGATVPWAPDQPAPTARPAP